MKTLTRIASEGSFVAALLDKQAVAPGDGRPQDSGLRTQACGGGSRRAGITLLELLVVLMILLMVTAAAIPMMAPALNNRKMREAARITSSFVSGARSRAIASGRETGVVLERFGGAPYANALAYVEVPPPYAGELRESGMNVSYVTSIPAGVVPAPAGYTAVNNAWLKLTPSVAGVSMPASINYKLLRLGDQIQFNFQGPLFTIVGPDSNNDGVVDSTATEIYAAIYSQTVALQTWPWPPSPLPPPPPLPVSQQYQVFRQPLRSSDTPLQLPDGVVVDLIYSGMGLTGSWGNIVTPVPPAAWQTNPPVPFSPMITFTPSGAVGHVGTTSLQRPTGPLYLLLGRRELMADAAKSQNDENIFEPVPAKPKNLYLANFWITVGYQTGLVTVTEVATNLGPVADPSNFLRYARAFAETAQSVGGQ